jgi:hypothetical protein
MPFSNLYLTISRKPFFKPFFDVPIMAIQCTGIAVGTNIRLARMVRGPQIRHCSQIEFGSEFRIAAGQDPIFFGIAAISGPLMLNFRPIELNSEK